MSQRKLTFKNGVFTVLQVTDPQDLQYVRRTMLWMLDKAYDRVKPDLVLLTGDNTLGNHFRDAMPVYSRLTVNTKEKEFRAMQKALAYVLEPIAERNIPFGMIYGNHDDMNEITKDEQADIYRDYPGCVGLDGQKDGVDCDTYVIPVYTEDGKRVAYNLWMLDSAWKDKETGECFWRVKPETVAWYDRTCKAMAERNGGKPVPALLFQHVPMPETLRLIEPCAKQKGAVEHGGTYYKLKPGVKGVMGEYPSVCEPGDGLFDAVKQNGDVKACVFGHDHLNCFEGTLDGVDLIATASASFRCYGGPVRGARVFRLFDDGHYETEHLDYFTLCGKNPVSYLRYLWDADDVWKLKAAVLGALAAGAAAGITAAIFRKR